jgi:hypothetical protein
MSPPPSIGELPAWIVRSGFYALILAQARMRREPLRHLLILGHMRSASTLLVHLLNSNREIAGFGEAHTSLMNKRDLDKLTARVKWTLHQPILRERYILDKILHDRYEIAPDILASSTTYSIFLLREARPTLSSITRQFVAAKSPKTLVDHEAYYCKRLASLPVLAQRIGDPARALLLLERDLMDRTSETFAALQRFLGTRDPFTEHYKLTPVTGTRIIGDSSEHIKAGTIERNRPAEHPDFPDEVIRRCDEAYRTCLENLRPWTVSVGTLAGTSGPMPVVSSGKASLSGMPSAR